MNVKQRLAALRGLLKKNGIQAYIIPSTDAHQSEYVPEFWHRREWISGFSGSAGDVVVTMKNAALWTDGRYFVQATEQLKGSGVQLMKQGFPETPSIAQWLSKQLPKSGKIGVDPRQMSITQYGKLQREFAELNLQLVTIEKNLIDELWSTNRPPAPDGVIQAHSPTYSGESTASKLKRLRKIMQDYSAKAHIITSLDAIAWLFNIRGSDVDHNPVVIGYAIVTDKTAMLFTDLHKITPAVKTAFNRIVSVHPYENFRSHVMKLAHTKDRIWLDPNLTSFWIADLLGKQGKIFFKESPILLFRAEKNSVELRGAREAHIRDGVAMVKFLYWLDKTLGKKRITEMCIADALYGFRSQQKRFVGTSFDTIVGYGAHGAIIHYSATEETNIPLQKKNLVVVDSGAQYLDGTTDITRTLCLGNPTPEHKELFTRVLKGHIQLTLTSFPEGTTGKQLDTIARKALWDVGLNYNHGTGHGVGSYLGVHEGPQSISLRDTGVPLIPGMVCSNEPGYYREGSFGIRTENLVYVIKDKRRSKGKSQFFTFETLTLCPIDRKLIDKRIMNVAEIQWLNAYHARVCKTLTPFLTRQEAAWLVKATLPL